MYINVEKLLSVRVAISHKRYYHSNSSLLRAIEQTYSQLECKDLIRLLNLIRDLNQEQKIRQRADELGICYCPPYYSDDRPYRLQFLDGHCFETTVEKLNALSKYSPITADLGSQIITARIRDCIWQRHAVHKYDRDSSNETIELIQTEIKLLLGDVEEISVLCFLINQWQLD